MEQRQFSNKVEDFKQFLTEFCEEFKEKCETEDSVPIRIPNPRILPQELEGECLEWCRDFLSTRGCPIAFSALISHEVYEQIADGDLDSFLTDDVKNENQKIETDKVENKDVNEKDESEKQIEYCAEKLHTHVVSVLEAVCRTWLNNFPEIQVDGSLPVISYHCIKNTRRKMEDKHVILPDLNALFGLKGHPPQSFYGVFDGHAGIDAALFASKHIQCNLVHQCDLNTNPAEACKHAFKVTDDQYIPKAKQMRWRSGCTGVTALVRGNKLYLSWLGDSQAVLVKNGKSVFNMEPHKPDRQDERDRIEAQGGFVVLMGDLWRVGGNLAVSRAIGDVGYKPFISSDAEVIEIDFDGTEEYMVLACDGLWDVVTEEELPRLVYNYLLESNNDRQGVAKYLVQYAKENESMDNISVIVVFFREIVSEPVADACFFNFFAGDSQGSNGSGENGGNLGANNSDKSDKKGGNTPERQDNQSCDNRQNQDRQFDDEAPAVSDEVIYEDESEEENQTCQSYPIKRSGLRQPDLINSEITSDISDENEEFSISNPNAQSREQSEEYISESSGHVDYIQEISESKNDKDLDCYGVFNTRLLDGPIDLSILDDQNSSYLLKDIATSVYNQKSQKIGKFHSNNYKRIQRLQETEPGPVDFSTFGPFKSRNKDKKGKSEAYRSRKDIRRKGHGTSPVLWAFTGRNQASVQNHRLNMAAKAQKGTNPTPGELTLANKAPSKCQEKSLNKVAQPFSSSENVHEIANITLSHGRLESLPKPRPKVLSKNLKNLPGFTVFGSKASLQTESEKFHTKLRPRKPLKPITSVVYETPPTPFVSNKLGLARQQ